MKILLAEDVDDLRELAALMIQSFYSCEITEVADGAKAIEALNQQAFDLIVSDYNMPNKNGGDVYRALRSQSKSTPFIMLSSDHPSDHPEFNGDRKFGYIEKPFTEESIKAAIESVMPDVSEQNALLDYIPVNLNHLLSIKSINAALYLRLSEKKFVKTHAAGTEFTPEDVTRYRSKDIHHLYVHRDEYSLFILDYKKTVLSQLVLSDFKPQERINYLADDVSLIGHAAGVFGWNEEVIGLANQNIEKVHYLSRKTPEFKEALNQILSKSHSRNSMHSVLLSMAFAGVAKELKISDEDLLRLTSAAILHDILLSEDFFIEKISILPIINSPDIQANPEVIKIKSHPLEIADTIRRVSLMPITIDTIVLQHHEKPDGSGFPIGLKYDQIHSLARVFIVAEDVIYGYLQSQGKADPLEYIKSREAYYAHPSFKPIYQAFTTSLQG